MTKKKRKAAKVAAAKAAAAPKPAIPAASSDPIIPAKYAEEASLVTRGSASNLSDDILDLYNKEKSSEVPRTSAKESTPFGNQRSRRIEGKYKEIQERYAKKFGDITQSIETSDDFEGESNSGKSQTNSQAKKDIKSQIDIGSDNFKRVFVADVLKKKPE